MSTDPKGFVEANLHSHNRYAYANNNPYKYVDPDSRAAVLPLIPLIPPALSKATAIFTALAAGGFVGYNIHHEWNKNDPAPTSNDNSKSGQKCVDDLIDESDKGRETKGRAEQYIHEGGREQRDRDFDALGVTEVKDRGKGTRTGRLPDGRAVNARDSKVDGVPTIQIQDGKRDIKIRYPDKE